MPIYIATETAAATDTNLFDRVIKGNEYELCKCGIPDHIQVTKGLFLDKDSQEAEQQGTHIRKDRIVQFVELKK